MKCPKRVSETFAKAGFIRKKQRFLCKNCGCQFTQDFIGRYGQNVKLQALKLYKEGNGFRRIGRILGISFEIARLWILDLLQHFKPNFGGEYDAVEADELCTFLKNEKTKDGFGLLIIAIQGKYLTAKLEIEDSKLQKNSSQD